MICNKEKFYLSSVFDGLKNVALKVESKIAIQEDHYDKSSYF